MPHDFWLYLEWLLGFFLLQSLFLRVPQKVPARFGGYLFIPVGVAGENVHCPVGTHQSYWEEQLQAAASSGTSGSCCAPEPGVILLLEHRRACNCPITAPYLNTSRSRCSPTFVHSHRAPGQAQGPRGLHRAARPSPLKQRGSAPAQPHRPGPKAAPSPSRMFPVVSPMLKATQHVHKGRIRAEPREQH